MTATIAPAPSLLTRLDGITAEAADVEADADDINAREGRGLAVASSEWHGVDDARAQIAANAVALLADVRPVLDNLTVVLDLITEVAEHFSCMEADAVARLMVSAGRTEDAASFVRYHAADDDEGDPHAPIPDAYDAVRLTQHPSEPDCAADEARMVAARAYVATLVTA